MSVEFSTPEGALLALAVVVPVAAFVAVSRRATRVRQALGLGEPPQAGLAFPFVAVLATAGVLGLAAAQPQVEHKRSHRVRSDAEVLVVMDVSRSMLAQRRLDVPTRFERAKAAAARFRAALPDVKVGLASMTNRVLPHLFPSADADVFDTTLEQVVGIENPPPGASFLTIVQRTLRNATSLSALGAVGRQRFFSPAARHRLLVVLTDGESPAVSAQAVGRSLQAAGIESMFIQFWAPGERVFSNGRPERQYKENPEARAILDRLAAATGGTVFDESGLGAAVEKARQSLGSGPTVAEAPQPDRLALAPYLAVVAFLPLAILLWRRDR